jgi:excisionase family DNA binding protein
MPRPVKREPPKRLVYKVNEVATMLGVNRKTIYEWLEKGLLRAVPIPGGNRMVDARSVEKLIEGKGKISRKGQALGQADKEPS